MWCVRVVIAAAISVLPSFVKIPIYRLVFRYRIGRGVRIGPGVLFIGVRRCRIGDCARIGAFNGFDRVREVEIGPHARIGHFNLFRGGECVRIGAYATVLRCNVFNSILQADLVNVADPVIELGAGAVVTTGHWLDFTDRVTIGPHSILGGRNSSLWTHNRQRTRPISVGPHCYFGSGVQLAPGVEVAPYCIVALGSVLMGHFDLPRSLIAGNPARITRSLTERDVFLVTRKTRNDIPDHLAGSMWPAELWRSGTGPDDELHSRADSDTHVPVGTDSDGDLQPIGGNTAAAK